YFFVRLDEAGACVSCEVLFDGLTPSVGTAVVVVVVVDVVVVVPVGSTAGADGESFFTCPGALAELPGEPSPPFPFPLPRPLPASAEPANTKIARTSTNAPVSRIDILPFPTTHVSEEDGFVQSRLRGKGGHRAALFDMDLRRATRPRDPNAEASGRRRAAAAPPRLRARAGSP